MRNGHAGLLIALLALGCSGELVEDLGAEDTDLLSSNALSSNALSSNALSSNALSSNALSSNGLLAVSESLQDPAKGALLAQLIKYSARCMLTPDQTVTVEYVSATGAPRTDVYSGNLGLEPTWADEGLSDDGRLYWGACLGAHTNVDGVSIPISVRNDAMLLTTPSEMNQYKKQEGGFWAHWNPGAPQPLQIFACSGTSPDARFCNEADCGSIFTRVGRCERKTSGTVVPFACESSTPGNVDACHGAASTSGSWSDPGNHKVITVYRK